MFNVKRSNRVGGRFEHTIVAGGFPTVTAAVVAARQAMAHDRGVYYTAVPAR